MGQSMPKGQRTASGDLSFAVGLTHPALRAPLQMRGRRYPELKLVSFVKAKESGAVSLAHGYSTKAISPRVRSNHGAFRAFETVSPELTSEPIYLYSICPRPSQPLVLPLGLAEPTQLIAVDDVAALVETGVDLAALQTDEPRLLNAVLSHDRVICELFQHTSLLPLRFGTQIASVEHLREHLASQGADYTAKLKILAPKVEYQVKLLAAEVAAPPLAEGLTGREYFLAKKQRLQDQTTAQEQQQAELALLLDHLYSAYGDSIESEAPAGEARIYVLVDRDDQTLPQWIEEMRSQSPHWTLILSEPLPPYHFV